MQKNLALRKFIQENPDISNKEGAATYGCSQSTFSSMKYRMKKEGLKDQIEIPFEPPLKDKVYNLLKVRGRKLTLEELSNRLDVSPKKIREAIRQLEAEYKRFHFEDEGIQLQRTMRTGGKTVLDDYHFQGEWVKFGFVTDQHLGSKYERLDVLNAAYDIFEKEGIKVVYQAGNMIDGEARFNKFDIHKYGIDNQVNYLVKKWPIKDGINTYMITGDDHEGWYTQREGIDIGKLIQYRAEEAGRKDIHYIGHMEHDIVVKMPQGEMVIRIVHPGGGSSYAISYAPQKIVESYSTGEKPNIILIGHYHKSAYNFYRGVHIIQGGCMQDQTPFMRKKKIQAHVGFWIIEVKLGANAAIQRIKQEFFPFFDRKYYGKKWKYQW